MRLFVAALALAAAPAQAGTGGPDAFGYTWADSNEPGVSYVFEDIRSTGAYASVTDSDDSYQWLSLGFGFPFYDQVYSSISIQTNGGIGFEQATFSTTNYCLPTGSGTNDALIAAMWDDLDPSGDYTWLGSGSDGGDIFWEQRGTAGVDRRFIVQWQDVIQYGGSIGSTFQVVLWEDGRIDLAYQTLGYSPSSATIGIQKDASWGLQVGCNDGSAVSSGMLVAFEPPDYLDLDRDGYDNTVDCDDRDASSYPGASELCDGIDQNCDGSTADEIDGDGDGVRICAADCDDGDAGTYPGAPEACDGLDQNCDGYTGDEVDGDLDGYLTCSGDCDDTDSSIHPGATELCDGIDQACDGLGDEADADADGYRVCDADCDDNDATRHPGATELCNGVDDNCDGDRSDEFDSDFDGYRICDGDCNDLAQGTHPGAIDIPGDGIDQDCDGVDAGGGSGTTGTGTGAGTGSGSGTGAGTGSTTGGGTDTGTGAGTGGTGTGTTTGTVTGTATGTTPGATPPDYSKLGGCGCAGPGSAPTGGLASLALLCLLFRRRTAPEEQR